MPFPLQLPDPQFPHGGFVEGIPTSMPFIRHNRAMQLIRDNLPMNLIRDPMRLLRENPAMHVMRENPAMKLMRGEPPVHFLRENPAMQMIENMEGVNIPDPMHGFRYGPLDYQGTYFYNISSFKNNSDYLELNCYSC